jgi:hypothetical protein
MRMFYTLNEDHQPKLVTNINEICDHEKFRVGLTKILWITVSTVFLGIDHRFDLSPGTKPILWETMIFGGKHDQYQQRYTSEADAKNGHIVAVLLVLKSPFISFLENIRCWWASLS